MDGIVAANAYAGFTGSTYNASSWSTGADLPYLQLVAVTGGSTSVWRCDTDHANFHMRFGVGVVNTDGAISVSAKVIMRGAVTGFTGLTPMAIYYAQDAIGTLGLTAGTTEVVIGTAVSPTEIIVGLGSDKPQFITSQTFNTTSGGTTNNIGIMVGKYAKMITGLVGANDSSASANVAHEITIYKNGKTSGGFSDKYYAPGAVLSGSLSWSGNIITASAGVDAASFTAYIYR